MPQTQVMHEWQSYLLRLTARLPWPFLGGPFPLRFSISNFANRLKQGKITLLDQRSEDTESCVLKTGICKNHAS